MALPKLPVPTYTVKCPSGNVVTFRPFLVKEEKLLMIAMQSGDHESMVNTTQVILENCVAPYTDIKISKLPLFDVEFLFLQLRARSIGETVKLKYACNQKIEANGESKVCGTSSEYQVNLLEIKPTFGQGHEKKVVLTPTMGLILQYPTFRSFQNLKRDALTTEESFAFISGCIESVWDENTVYTLKDVAKAEVEEFVNSLSHKHIEAIDTFFTTMPKIEHTLKFACPKCGHKEDIVVRGLDSFFG